MQSRLLQSTPQPQVISTSTLFPAFSAGLQQETAVSGRREGKIFLLLKTSSINRGEHSGKVWNASLHFARRRNWIGYRTLFCSSCHDSADIKTGRQSTSGRSSAWLERRVWDAEVARSNRVAPTSIKKAVRLNVERLFLFRKSTRDIAVARCAMKERTVRL
jgi:hypothetical protein